jgi:hypothetical protein
MEITLPTCHFINMMDDPPPPMTPRKREDTSGWMVLVCWPDGREEKVNGFRSLSDVGSWFSFGGSQEWLNQHLGNKKA